jgi:hypothetical protein
MAHDSRCRDDSTLALNRRELLGRYGMRFGLIALAGLLADDTYRHLAAGLAIVAWAPMNI